MSARPSFWRRALQALARGGTPSRRQFFAGSQHNRLTGDFRLSAIGPKAELKWELGTLRQRARELERNNPHARRYLSLLAENVVGHRGIRLQAMARTRTGDLDRAANTQIEAAWAAWGRRESCTVTGRMSWIETQQHVIKSVARDGECFIRTVTGFDNPFGFALQVLDPDQFDDAFGTRPAGGKTTIVTSIELDEWDRPVRYWHWTASPYEYGTVQTKERTALPAEQMIHLFRPRRAGQVRGETWFAPIMITLNMLNGYAEAEVTAARTAAAKMGWIEMSENADGFDPNAASPAGMPLDAEPGSISRLAPGEKFTAWDPSHPSGNFGPFTDSVLHQIAAGLNVSHASMTGDLTKVNYSSARVGLLVERDHWRTLQGWFAEAFCDVVYRRWLRAATLSGALVLPSERLSDYETVQWRPRGWTWVDPLKDVQAAALAVAYGFTSRRRVIADEGEDLEEIADELAEDAALYAEYGVPLQAPSGVTVQTEGADDAEDDDPDDADDAADPGDAGGRAVAAGDHRARRAGDARGRGRADPGLHLLRAAGGAVVRP